MRPEQRSFVAYHERPTRLTSLARERNCDRLVLSRSHFPEGESPGRIRPRRIGHVRKGPPHNEKDGPANPVVQYTSSIQLVHPVARYSISTNDCFIATIGLRATTKAFDGKTTINSIVPIMLIKTANTVVNVRLLVRRNGGNDGQRVEGE
ncbi:hypothetical protein V1478_010258 [Vespula squamosa]|uniref:Uncharacterized protein n=1 Tax=Vespula squamosa TaxID=30214 RepID=A0ABD2AK39_VESSQ